MHESSSFRSGAIIVATLFCTLGLLYGVWYSYSVFLVALVGDFGWSRSVTAGAMSVFILVHGGFGPIAGRLVERFGPRRLMLVGSLVMASGLALTALIQTWWQLYLSYGVLTAVGLGACGWVPSVILAEKWFPNRVGTALGIVTAGIGVGILGVVPLTNFLVETFDWRRAFQVLAVLVAVVIAPAALFILREPKASPPLPKHRPGAASAPPPAHYWTVRSALRSRAFRFAVLAFFTGGSLSQMLLMHQFAFMVDHGVAKTAGSLIVGVIGITSIPAKIVWGSLSDRIGREVTYSFGLACILLSVLCLAFIGALPGLAMPIAFALLLGTGYAANAPIIPAAARDLFAGPKFPSIFGTLSMFAALGGATGSWLGGALHDLTGDYRAMLLVAGALAICAPCMLWIAAPRRPQPPPLPA
ncbi:MAG: MFS transporter [Gammaproteobacteria bacterium]|nr:MFS transporter [Gammaproteobacteria bacterium]MBK8133048.1 MFS transporter [Gammaproteobacteria bacterium]